MNKKIQHIVKISLTEKEYLFLKINANRIYPNKAKNLAAFCKNIILKEYNQFESSKQLFEKIKDYIDELIEYFTKPPYENQQNKNLFTISNLKRAYDNQSLKTITENVCFFLNESYYNKKIALYLKEKKSLNLDINNFLVWINLISQPKDIFLKITSNKKLNPKNIQREIFKECLKTHKIDEYLINENDNPDIILAKLFLK